MAERGYTVEVGGDSALVVYCVTCARVLADLPSVGNGLQTLAHSVAFDHWASYREDHTVLVGDLVNHRMEMVSHNGQFKDISDHD